jgi:hypothetical protein
MDDLSGLSAPDLDECDVVAVMVEPQLDGGTGGRTRAG